MINDINLMRMPLGLFLMALLVACTNNSVTPVTSTCETGNDRFGNSITTIDSVTFYWNQLAEDSVVILKVKDGVVIHECLVTGPAQGVSFGPDKSMFYIWCGGNDYVEFETELTPSEINILTDEEFDNYDIEKENADSIINLY